MPNSNVKINARKFDGSLHRSWEAELVSESGNLLLFRGIFDEEVIHPELGAIRSGTISYEYYWTNRWYNVFRFHEPDGEFRNFYCNINMPPVFENSTLSYTDLDIDVLVEKDWSVQVLDLKEFERNSIAYGYGDEIRKTAMSQIDVLTDKIESRRFPFDLTTIDLN